jgi:hypothetical protein
MTGIVVGPEVAYLRVVGSFPTQWTRLSTEQVRVDSRFMQPPVCTRPGGHRRQMEAQSHVLCLMEHAYSHPNPMHWGSVMGHWAQSSMLHTLNIINWIFEWLLMVSMLLAHILSSVSISWDGRDVFGSSTHQRIGTWDREVMFLKEALISFELTSVESIDEINLFVIPSNGTL